MAQNHELYRYCAPGQRSEKYARSDQRRQQVRYLPGLEIRTCTATTAPPQQLHVIAVGHSRLYQAGRRTFTHFNLCDRLDSITGVVNEAGQWVSHESFYPFGGTACWLTDCQAGAAIKFQRYAGRERDTTGLSCYEWRYYVPWLMRWLNSDPAGTIDGLNLFRMVGNNPLTLRDRDGRMMEGLSDNVGDNVEQFLATSALSKELQVFSCHDVDEVVNQDNSPHPGPSHPDELQPFGVPAKARESTIKKTVEWNQCKQKYVSDRELLKHRKNTGCKFIYKCGVEGCNKVWKKKDKLARHMATHSKEKTFLCEYADCGKKFITRDNCKSHFKTCHREKRFHCLTETCRMLFSSKKNRDSHFAFCQKTKEEDRFLCIFCDNWYTNPYLVNRHVNKYHPLPKPTV